MEKRDRAARSFVLGAPGGGGGGEKVVVKSLLLVTSKSDAELIDVGDSGLLSIIYGVNFKDLWGRLMPMLVTRVSLSESAEGCTDCRLVIKQTETCV